MMRKLRFFKCSETGEVFEKFADDDERIIKCSCGGLSERQLSAPRSFGNTTGRSPSSSYAKPR